MIGSADEFVYLRESDDPNLYLRAANDSASVEVWLDVLAKYPDMASWVAHNKTIPVEIMELLARSDDLRVRWTIAAKRRCPPALLEVLARDPDSTVRLRVAYNAKTPPSILCSLLQDPWHQVIEVAHERLSKLRVGQASPGNDPICPLDEARSAKEPARTMNLGSARLSTWIAQGKQIGARRSIERDGKTFHLSFGMQKQGEKYKVVVNEYDAASKAMCDPYTREESLLFDTLEEAVAYVESTTPVKIEELRPAKGQKWFR